MEKVYAVAEVKNYKRTHKKNKQTECSQSLSTELKSEESMNPMTGINNNIVNRADSVVLYVQLHY